MVAIDGVGYRTKADTVKPLDHRTASITLVNMAQLSGLRETQSPTRFAC